jgi:hypothetical protein
MAKPLKPTRADRRSEQTAALRLFVQQYGRPKGRSGLDPNDRQYDQALQRRIRRMRPTELDALLRGEDDEVSE